MTVNYVETKSSLKANNRTNEETLGANQAEKDEDNYHYL